MPPLPAAGSERIEMSRKYVRVAVDAMGGDLAPAEPVKAAVEALEKRKSLHVTLVGQEEVIRAELAKYKYPEDRLEILDAREIIEMSEPPVNAIRKKKDSSIVRGLKLVKEGTCDAFVTAGSTGATLAGGQLLVGRIRGIERPPLAPLMPTAKGPVLLVDCGANMDARPSQLVQFAQMGSIYMKNMTGVENPRVALVNVGAEEEKGNALVKEVYPLLKECEGINFIGNIEARDIPAGEADVVVCDAFVGNVIRNSTSLPTAERLCSACADLWSRPTATRRLSRSEMPSSSVFYLRKKISTDSSSRRWDWNSPKRRMKKRQLHLKRMLPGIRQHLKIENIGYNITVQ